ncbi:MAG: lytic transglycosylase domain-containing protein [Bdellovibrionales bacterium]|nr:lytic transglycosylase domain-containing protein [Bdellovibrionales bacterium]
MVVHIVSKLALVGMVVGLHSQLPVSSSLSLSGRRAYPGVNHFYRTQHLQRILGNQGLTAVPTLRVSEQNDDIEAYIKDYVTTKLSRLGFESQTETVLGAIFRSASKYQVDPLFIVSMIEQESQFNLKALGRHGEIGLLQIKPKTAEWAAKKLGLELISANDLWNPEINLDISVAYLKHLQTVFSRLPLSHLDAYNRGTGSVLKSQSRGEIEPTEYSRSIIQRLTRHYQVISNTLARN